MRRLTLSFLFVLLATFTVSAQCVKVNGWAEQGGMTVVTSGVTSTSKVQRSFPSASVTVYQTGTLTLQDIWSDSGCSVVKANPFTASATDASYSFYVATPARLDLRFAATGLSTFTISDIFTSDGVVGPSSATDNAVARWNGTSGDVLQNSVTTISDAGNITSPGTVMTFGDNSVTASSRIVQTTQSNEVYSLGVQTTNFTNGPVISPNYKDHVGIWGYNTAANATKITASKVNFGFANESDWYPTPVEADKQSEHYFFWTPADNSYTQRPWGFIVKQQSGDVSFELHGTQNFGRDHDQGGGIWGTWSEAGALDLSLSSNTAISFGNNRTDAIRFKNAANTNTIGVISLNASDKVVVDPGGNGLILGAGGSNISAPTLIDVSTLSGTGDSDTLIQFLGSGIMDIRSDGNLNLRSQPNRVDSSVDLVFAADNTKDFGFTNSTNQRPRNVYAGTSVISPLYRSSVAKVLLQGTGTGATQISSTQTTPPTCSNNCGTSPSVVGTDSDMRITMGAAGSPASGFIVTFNGTWAAAPVCSATMATTGMVVGKLALTVVTTTTTITVVTNGTAPGNSDTYAIMCRGVQ